MTNYKITEANGTYRTISSSTAEKVKQAFDLFNKLFKNCGPNEVFVSFNGGKDCTVVLHLLSSYFLEHEHLNKFIIPVLYIQPKCPFQQVEDFVTQCEQTYRVEMIKQRGSIKGILQDMCAERPNLQAVVMGIRGTDPHGRNMKPMQQTDPGWPPLLRVNPLLDWTCQDIWTYLRENKVPYCSLYDMGYTSLGDTSNTNKNPHLRREDPVTGEVTYRPAYELLDDTLEREGRC